jgi:hypothetical protein
MQVLLFLCFGILLFLLFSLFLLLSFIFFSRSTCLFRSVCRKLKKIWFSSLSVFKFWKCQNDWLEACKMSYVYESKGGRGHATLSYANNILHIFSHILSFYFLFWALTLPNFVSTPTWFLTKIVFAVSTYLANRWRR